MVTPAATERVESVKEGEPPSVHEEEPAAPPAAEERRDGVVCSEDIRSL